MSPLAVTGRYRIAIIGAGGIGSSATYWLNRALGRDVVCLEQWQPGHDRGASEDHSRIIRLGYHASRYTALTRASSTWSVVEQETATRLVPRTGMLNFAPAGSESTGILRSYEQAMRARHRYERLDTDVSRRHAHETM